MAQPAARIQFIHRRPTAKLGDIVLDAVPLHEAEGTVRALLANTFEPPSPGTAEYAALASGDWPQAFRLARDAADDPESNNDSLEFNPH